MKCESLTKSGKQCSAPAISATGVCAMHTPGTAKILGARGGRRRARFAPENLKALRVPKTARDIGSFLAECLAELRAGLLEPKTANAISVLAMGVLRSLEVAKSTRRTLEDLMFGAEAESD